MSNSIKNKVALVTGANRGIGKSIVETFIRHGARKVYLAVRNTESTKVLIDKYGDKVEALKADLGDTNSIIQLAKQAEDVEILVNNAGIGTEQYALGENVEKDLTNILNVNVFGVLRIANAFADILIKNKGAFVQVNSIESIMQSSQHATYSASKAAAYSLTQSLRDEFGAKGVAVVSVHPGPVDSDLARQAGFYDAPSPSIVSEGIVNALKEGEFLVFPDKVAKKLYSYYQSYAEKIILSPDAEEVYNS